jgi:hypothetical protein
VTTTQARCHQALGDVGFTPSRLVGETIRFSPRDLEHATEALAGLLRTDADRLLTAEVIYAFGER